MKIPMIQWLCYLILNLKEIWENMKYFHSFFLSKMSEHLLSDI